MIWLVLVFTVVIILLLFSLQGKNREIASLKLDVEAEVESMAFWKKRVGELEDGLEKGYGVTVRTEVKQKVDTDLTKLEMVVMMAGVDKLIRDSRDRNDTQFYLNLHSKVFGIVELMEEEVDGDKSI